MKLGEINLNTMDKSSKEISELMEKADGVYKECKQVQSDIHKRIAGAISKIHVGFNLKKIVHTMYQIVSVISTLAIFTGALYFVIGKVTNNNQSDNDLIMKQIKADIGENQQIINIEVADIHGFGNDSIIVTTANGNMSNEGDNNKLVILESVENEILNSMNDLLGLKSNYKITFSYGFGRLS